MVPIPEVQPGDTVWWHTDICHAVGDEHARQGLCERHLYRLGARIDAQEPPQLSS